MLLDLKILLCFIFIEFIKIMYIESGVVFDCMNNEDKVLCIY